jgi:hypothetical protein
MNTRKRKWRRGEAREDGYIFNRYVKVKRKNGTITLCPQFLRPSVFKRTASKLKTAIRNWQKKNAKRLQEKRNQHRRENAEHYRDKSRSNYYKNREKLKLRLRDRYAANPEKYRRFAKEWRERNPDYQKIRFAKHPEAKMAAMLRRRLLKALDGEVKSGSTYELLGCTWRHLRLHIESQFDANMTWANHGSYWHLDHIVPLDAFDLTDPEQQRRACHWKNLQPLEAKENIRKKNRLQSSPRRNATARSKRTTRKQTASHATSPKVFEGEGYHSVTHAKERPREGRCLKIPPSKSQ